MSQNYVLRMKEEYAVERTEFVIFSYFQQEISDKNVSFILRENLLIQNDITVHWSLS